MEYKSNSAKLLACYLEAIGIEGFEIEETQDEIGYLLIVKIPKANKERIGIFRGKRNKNLNLLKKLLKVVGYAEKKTVYLLVKLVD